MEERVRELFKDGLKCNEEVEQIKNIYKYVILNRLSKKTFCDIFDKDNHTH